MVARTLCYANGMLRYHFLVIVTACAFFGAGCMPAPAEEEVSFEENVLDATELQQPVETEKEMLVVYPVEGYIERRTEKWFGKYVQDRFVGYYAGDDIEFTDDASRAREVPVVAIADGEVVRVGRVGGYGGLMIVRFAIKGRIITALYGHIDLGSTELRPGDLVTRGQFLANLGDHESTETDGERKHLHFGVYEGSDGRVNGYEAAQAGLEQWIDPSAFLAQGG